MTAKVEPSHALGSDEPTRTPAPHCLCERCTMTVLQCRGRGASSDVLDDFVDWCKDAISSLEEKQCDGYRRLEDVVKVEFLHYELKIIKELRQQTKERE